MAELKDFQKATVNYIFDQLYISNSEQHRFLVADEVGLGKTLIARGVIEKAVEKFKNLKKHLNVIYVCSNQNIAKQNLTKLNVTGNSEAIDAKSRLAYLAYSDQKEDNSFLKLIALSPKTSLDVDSSGLVDERAILFNILKQNENYKRRSTNLHRMLMVDVKESSWKRYIADPRFSENLKPEIVTRFNSELNKNKKLSNSIESLLNSTTPYDRALIGELRQLLAKICVSYLKPDLIILDEFQRFKDLITQTENFEIADVLFNTKDAKLLLLSATPYKMYTIASEHSEGENHYDEFFSVLKFLLGDKISAFQSNWEKYSKSILRMENRDETEMLKNNAEKILRQVMCRTERIQVANSDSSIVRTKRISLSGLSLEDLENYRITDEFCKYFEKHEINTLQPVEFCKSSPFPLSFMDDYKLKSLCEEELDYKNNSEFLSLLENSKHAFLNQEKINTYELENYPNAKLNYLINDNVKDGANLLWLPPSLPYYKLGGSFENKNGYSKTMIFSDYVLIPKMIATLVSYESERICFSDLNSNESRTYFHSASADRLPRPRLNYREEKKTLSLFNLFHPNLRLSELYSFSSSFNSDVDLNSLKASLHEKVSEQFKIIKPEAYIKEHAQVDERWYWVFPLLMDIRQNSFVSELYEYEYVDDFKDYIYPKTSVPKNFQEHYDFLYNELLFSELNGSMPGSAILKLNLGQMPIDLIEVVVLQILGSPANIALRSLLNHFPNYSSVDYKAFFYSYSRLFAELFRDFYNRPETISVIDYSTKRDIPFWRAVLEYNANGCLQAVVDEYLSILFESVPANKLELDPFDSLTERIDEVFKKFKNGLLIQTSNLSVDSYQSFFKKEKIKMRSHYAVGFYDLKESDGSILRKESVQESFNSPFRPFVLATTSIGQEGLDFHQYCRKVLHWNLPSNPVDLEQREGRVNRFKSLSIRQSIAYKYQSKLIDSKMPLWEQLFLIAKENEKGDRCDLVPNWHIDNSKYPIERQVPMYPFSKEEVKLENLLKTLSVYRIALGQPNQEELITYLFQNLPEEEVNILKDRLLINLSPISFKY